MVPKFLPSTWIISSFIMKVKEQVKVASLSSTPDNSWSIFFKTISWGAWSPAYLAVLTPGLPFKALIEIPASSVKNWIIKII